MKRIVCIGLCMAFLCAFSITAMAESGNRSGVINNEIIGTKIPSESEDTTVQEITNGFRAIVGTGEQNRITMPDEDNYFSTIQPLYIDAPKNHSVYVYWDEFGRRTRSDIYAYEGMKVYAVADSKAGTHICIVFSDQQFNYHTGWVSAKNLSYTYPGTIQTSGMPAEDIGLSVDDPVLSWSREPFVGTRQKFLFLDEPIENTISFQLEYQVTDRGGMLISDVLGIRTVYVNDGRGWVAVGAFSYPEIVANLITVNLPYQMDVKAIAVKSDCTAADVLTFRMMAFHFVKSLQNSGGGTQSSIAEVVDKHIVTRVNNGETYYLVDLSELNSNAVIGNRGLGVYALNEDIMGTGGSLSYLKLQNPIRNCVMFAMPIAVFGDPNFDFSDVTWCVMFKDGQNRWTIVDQYDYVDGKQQFCGINLDWPVDVTAITVAPYNAPHGFGDFTVRFTPTSAIVGFKDYADAVAFVKGML